MKWIAIIAVVGIIALAVIIGLLIQRLKNRQAEELANLRRQLKLAQDQLQVATPALKTIRDLQGDSAFDAMTTLENMERLRDQYYNNQTNQEGISQ